MYERTNLSTVLSSIDPKRRALGDEHAAFEAFRSRLTELAPFEPALDCTRRQTERQRLSTTRIETAYRETIMSVPHYQAWYNHTYVRSLTTVLGPTLATVLSESPDVGSPEIGELIETTARCIDRRDEMIDAIDRERANVQTVADRLAEGYELLDYDGVASTTSQPVDQYRTTLDRLTRISQKRERAVERRRQHLRRCRDRDWPGTGESCRAFLYDHLDTSYPVLAAITALGQEIGECHRTLQQGVDPGQREACTGE